jgi:hypothetical protein
LCNNHSDYSYGDVKKMNCLAHDKYLKVVYKDGVPFMACAYCNKKSDRLAVQLIDLKNGYQEFKFVEVKRG